MHASARTKYNNNCLKSGMLKYTYIFIYIFVSVQVYMWVYICACLYVFVCVFLRTFSTTQVMPAYTHTHTYNTMPCEMAATSLCHSYHMASVQRWLTDSLIDLPPACILTYAVWFAIGMCHVLYTTAIVVVVVVMSYFRFSKSTIYVAPFFVIERAAAAKQSIKSKFFVVVAFCVDPFIFGLVAAQALPHEWPGWPNYVCIRAIKFLSSNALLLNASVGFQGICTYMRIRVVRETYKIKDFWYSIFFNGDNAFKASLN